MLFADWSITMYKKKLISIIACMMFAFLNVSYNIMAEDLPNKTDDNSNNMNEEDIQNGPFITSSSAVVIETVTNSVLYDKSSHNKLEASHLVKLMTLLLVAEAIDKGDLNFDTQLATSQTANSKGDPQIWLNVGEKISVDELIKSITIGNANDAAVVLAEAIATTESLFVDMMNYRAAELGMNDTFFVNCTGKDKEGNYSTAYDIAILCSKLLEHEYLCEYMTTWMSDVRQGQTNLVNSNKLVKTYNGITGIKAAASSVAGNCIALSATRKKLPLVCVVLGSKSNDTRFDESKALLDYIFTKYEYYVPSLDPELLNPVEVKGGQHLTVPIRSEDEIGLVITKGTAANIKSNIVLNDKIEAPVACRQVIGYAEFKDDDKIIFKTNIIACNEVKKKDILYCFKKIADQLFRF